MRQLLKLVAVLLACLATPALAEPYAAGTIRPSASAATADAALAAFYADWKRIYLREGCGEARAYVDVGGDGKPVYGGTEAKTITVSEAHGYGMLITVMMAAADAEAQRLFDAMLRYFHDHPAASDPGLLAWNQVAGCDNATEIDGSTTATDGDLDVAYALLLAEKTWGNGGEFDYGAEARRTISAILAREVDAKGSFLTLGDWATGDPTYGQATRSSDFMLSHLRAFELATGETRWGAVRDQTYAIIDAVRDPGTGLMPDFVVGLDATPRPAAPGFLEGEHDGHYSWNAARYPWRVALDYLLYGEPRAVAALQPLNLWAAAHTGGDPTRFAATHGLDGTGFPDQGENAMAFVSMLGPAAMIEEANQAWLDAVWDATLAADIADEDYFGNTLKLLAMLVMTGHWQKP